MQIHAQSSHRLAAFVFLLSFAVSELTASPLGAPEDDLRAQQESGPRHRSKRGIHEFGNMIRQVVQREALLYNNYGNHCGFGHSEEEPVDEVDRCCQQHDACYVAANAGVCSSSWFSASFVSFDWSWDGEVLSCNVEDPCKRTVCQCDATAALCFREHPYNADNKRTSIFDLLA